jgi:two-component system, cell cycle sensor histidine kinase and response regulator CckA
MLKGTESRGNRATVTDLSLDLGWSEASPYALALGVAALLGVALTVVGWRQRSRPGGLQFALLAAAAAVWALFYSLELTASTVDGKLLWARMEYLGIVTIPVAWFLFARSYTGMARRVNWRLAGVLWIVPLATVILVFTNDLHLLVWRSWDLEESWIGQGTLALSHGPWFWVNIGYSYLLIVLGSVVLLRTIVHYPKSYIRQAALLVAAVIAPWVGNGLSTFWLTRSWIDITPFAFLIAEFLLLLATSRRRLLSVFPVLLPMARTQVIERMNDGVLVLDMDGRVVSANPAARRMFAETGVEPKGALISELLGTPSVECGPFSDRRERRFEVSVGQGAHRRYFDVAGSPLDLRRGGVGSLLVFRDIGDRKRAEEALRTSRAQLEAAMDLADLVNWELDVETGIFTFNDRFYALLGTTADREGGYQMAADEYARRFVHPEDSHVVAQETQRAVDADDPDHRGNLEHRVVRRDGAVRHIIVRYGITKDERGRTIRTHGSNQDITERKQARDALAAAEEQLLQAQKMEAVGQLAGGIAHDFNNLLTSIIGNSSLILADMEVTDPRYELVNDVKEVGERAAGLTRQILAFSRRQVLQPKILSLNDVVRGLELLLVRTLGEDIDLRFVLAPDLALTEVDPHQTEQILMNLALNARDAMPGGGRLTIETANRDLDSEYCGRHAEVQPGRYAMLAVSDTGCGMSPETRSHVFEPFFTTKEVGKGTGLGLSTVFGVVSQSGGSISVYSEPGTGSTFKVYLPACDALAPEFVVAAHESQATRGSEVILVVEDEAAVRQLVGRILEGAGYQVVQAGSAREIDTALAGAPEPPDLLLADLVLPGGTSGREIARMLRQQHSALKVLHMSGYTRDSVTHDGRLDEGIEFLEKPFTPQALLAKVRAVLDSDGADARGWGGTLETRGASGD